MRSRKHVRPEVKAGLSDPLTEEFEHAVGDGNAESCDALVEEDVLVRHGLSIECLNSPADADAVQKWIIVKATTDRKIYAGRTLAWSPSKYANIAFESRVQATEAALRYADAMERFSATPEFVISQRSVRIPVVPDTGARSYPLRLSVMLDLEESKAVESLRKALSQLNAGVRPGKPVLSNADAVRWLLSQIYQDLQTLQ